MTADTAALKRLWMQAFGDPEEVPDTFFTTAFSPERCTAIWDGDTIVSALYWLDCSCNGHLFAYLYAVATDNAYRGQGYASRLLQQTHDRLKETGYAGAVLVPSSPQLFPFYEKLGYRTFCTAQEFTCSYAAPATPLTRLDAQQYARCRNTFLPAGSILHSDAALRFLETYGQFYRGDSFVLAVSQKDDRMVAHEFLGDPQAAPHILTALGASEGRFCMPGPGKAYAMYLPLQQSCPEPGWFGLALD